MSLLANFLGIEQWMVILVVALLLFGGKKIPELMRGLGRGVGELQRGLEDGKRALHNSMQEEAAKVEPAAATADTSATVAK